MTIARHACPLSSAGSGSRAGCVFPSGAAAPRFWGGGLLAAAIGLLGLVVATLPARAEVLDRTGFKLTFSYDFKDFVPPKADDVGHMAGPWTTVFWYNPGNVGDHTLPGNSELQLYVDPQYKGTAERPFGLNPFHKTEKGLSIVASEFPANVLPHAWGYRYQSGLLTTRKTFSQQFGYFELRAKPPSSPGAWPAFWLLPQDGRWPPEIDVFEMCCKDAALYNVALHWGTPQDHKRDGKYFNVADLSKDFHLFGVKWTKDEICFYLDDVKTFCGRADEQFSTPMYMLINLALVDPKRTVSPDSQFRLPAAFELDYVRAYSLE
ncbi:MAG: glycoside hydrolase family 16 protein [Alsobacter sp.]